MSVAWEELAPETREALGWAAAMEPLDVGTRTVLLGVIRGGRGVSDPEQLLRFFGCPKERLFDALQKVAPSPAIRPHVSRPAQLDALPKLSPNCKRTLERADAIREARRDVHVTPQHFFAAIFDFRRSTAYRALREVLGVDLQEVRDLYLDYLRDPHDDSFRDRLLHRYPSQGESVDVEALDAHSGPVTALCFSPDSEELVTAGSDGVIQTFSLKGDGPPVALRSPDAEQWTAVGYSVDGRYLAAGTSTGSLAVWRRQEDWIPLWGVPGGRSEVRAIAFSPDGSMAVGDSGGYILVYAPDLLEPVLLLDWKGAAGLTALAYSPDGESLAGSDEEGGLTLWDARSGEVSSTHVFEGEAVLALAFRSHDPGVVYSCGDGSIGVWEPQAKRIRALTWDPGGGAATAAALAGDVALGVSAHSDDAIRISSFGDGSSQSRLLGHHLAFVHSLGISRTGEWVAAGGGDGRVQLWQPGGQPLDAGVDWQLDSPLQAVEKDELDRKQLAGAIATRLRQVSASGPEESFLLHVDGPWGAGKSTVLELLAAELSAGPAEHLVVRFDAWRQSRVGPPWWALLTSLRSTLRESLGGGGRIRLRTEETFHQLREAWASSLLSLLILLLALIAFVLIDPSGGDLGKGVQLLAGVLAVLSSVWLLGGAAARSLLWESATGARLYEQSHQNPMESLAKHFAWLMSKTDRRVVFFLDDVDRCDKEYVVDLLDSVQTLVRDAPCTAPGSGGKPPYFIVAADGRWIRCSYEAVYEAFEDAVREPGRPLGYLFLDKIFQLTVRIPVLGREQRRAYLDHLLRRGSSTPNAQDPELTEGQRRISESRSQGEILSVVNSASPAAQPALRAAAAEQLATSEVVERTEHELQKFADLLEPNPRSMKRFVNAYSVALSTALLEERSLEPDHVALWVIVRTRWPELADYLGCHPEAAEAFASLGKEPGQPPPKEVAPLVNDPAVVEVLSFGSRPLGEEEILGLSGGFRVRSA